MASAKHFLAKHGLAIGTPSTIVFNSSGVLQASALSGATIAVTGIDIDGATDIGADLVDADLLLVDDGAGGTNRKTALSRIKKYVYSAVSGDATVSDSGALTIAATSVENSMLAGSIANSKLTNSTITVSDGSNNTATALGGTITFAATANETTVTESSGTVTIGLPDNVTLASNLNVGKNVVISGNLTVSGTQTVINSNTLNIGDNIIVLNTDETGTPSQNAGIEVERGSATNVVLRWNETTDKWQFTNDGSSYEDIGAGITVQEEGSSLSTAATTLNFVGSAVTATGSGATKTITITGGDVVTDTTPQLGGDLDLNSNDITGTGNLNITGNISLSGTVDGRDVATDGTKLDGIETGATDDATVLSTNTAIRALVTTEANRNTLVNSNLTATNTAIRALITTETARTTLVNSNLTATNTAIRSLVTAEANRNTLVNSNLTSTNTAIRALITAADLTGIKAETLLVKNPASHHTYTVTVASKTSAHPYTGTGSSSAYFLDGKESPSIVLAPNMTYRFDQADNTNNGHPLRFYLDAAKATAYTTNVTSSGTPGSSGAYTQIVVTDATPPVLYYQCSSHAHMGSVASSLTEGTTDHLTEGSTNLYYTDARVNTHLNVGSASSGQILSWNGSDYAWVADQTGGGGSSLTIQEEGSSLSTAATTLNFVGSGVTASGSGATKTITVSAASALTVQDEGSALSTAASTLNFVGSGVTASGTGATKTITIAGGSGTSVGANGNFGGTFEVGTGNGSATTFTSPISTNKANNVIVSVDGLMQRPTTDYTISGTTVTFGTAPPSGTTVMVRSFSGGLTNKAGINVQTFTSNGSNTVYKMADPVSSLTDVIVTVNGVVQRPTTDYTYSNPNITFDTALTSGDIIAFRSFNIQSSGSGFKYESVSSNVTMVAGKAYMVDCSSARTLTLPTSAGIGDEIRIIDATGQSGTNNITVARNSHKIQGAASNLTVSTNRAAFGLVYFNVAQGWLLTER